MNTEMLRLQGSGHVNGTGQTFAQDGLIGNSGNNQLEGRGGGDALHGGAGNDTLIGGEGRDWLTGGLGADMFVFRSTAESGLGWVARDAVNGFEHKSDKINLFTINANALVGGNPAFDFIGAAGFSGLDAGSAGELRADTWRGGDFVLLEMDVDGDGSADAQIMVLGTNNMPTIDFVL